MTEPKQTASPLNAIGGLASAAGGWALSQYCGIALFLPGAAALLLLLLFVKTPLHPKYFKGAIAVTTGHVISFVIGSALADLWASTAIDIVVLSAGVIWLWAKPGLAPVLFLGIVQLISLAVNVFSLTSAAFGDFAHRALTAHCLIRLLAIILLVTGFIRFRKDRPGPVSATGPDQ